MIKPEETAPDADNRGAPATIAPSGAVHGSGASAGGGGDAEDIDPDSASGGGGDEEPHADMPEGHGGDGPKHGSR
ncbi:hypothetical protein [Sphingomonas nostoxanthinifaciens]|uniref:hypothetical protein n=1 Tax=Sphingomonas nostoxanthinifaciens TaxID=2872652 RepID=UPI001CC216D0|nr:hypothetical protein [Sphingomonas nostoxanthinifaciens]UAK23515.1 hypothetical protein K8P63_14105 [Sphingomonas nostoxanthinifaciens]